MLTAIGRVLCYRRSVKRRIMSSCLDYVTLRSGDRPWARRLDAVDTRNTITAVAHSPQCRAVPSPTLCCAETDRLSCQYRRNNWIVAGRRLTTTTDRRTTNPILSLTNDVIFYRSKQSYNATTWTKLTETLQLSQSSSPALEVKSRSAATRQCCGNDTQLEENQWSV